MKSGTQTLPNFPLKGEVIDQPKDVQPADDDTPLELLMSQQMQGPIAWPRVFPGL